MPISPRTLRPGGTFSPRSIPGLALWLDASSSDSLFTTDAGPVSAVASPLDIAGCALWLDGADSSAASMTLDGSVLDAWKDKSGNGRDFTATTTARPTLTASVINSRSAVTFNGSTNTLTGNAAAQDVIRNLAGYTVFAALRTATVAAGERLAFGVGATVLFRIGQQDSRPFMGGRRVSADTLESVTGTASDLSVGAAFIQTASVNHTSQSLTGLRNGATFASDATYMASGSSENVASSVSVGTQAGGTYGFWNGEVAEIIAYDTALTTAQRASVEAYLASKWGISGVHVPATASSDPVGYWRDKSGNNRHAVQATAGSRPLVGTQNGRKALTFDGTNDSLRHIPSTAIGSTGLTIIAALKHNLTSQPYYLSQPLSLTATGAGRPLERWQGGASESIAMIGNGSTNVGGSYRQQPDRFVYSIDAAKDFISSGTHQLREFLNGATNFDILNTGVWTTSSQRINVGARDDGATQYKGDICELFAYDRRLTTAERQRAERYLASKWGITLAPQVSNADAQDWINRVYSNGGTVSTATAASVNTLCDSLDAASLRDRFYRLNLFCGTGLNAALVPLYRGPSLGGTQYGGTTDTNNAFVGVGTDYAETGASGGLTGNGSTKYLTFGTMAQLKPSWTTHHFGLDIKNGYPDATTRYQMGAFFNETPTSPRGAYAISGTSSTGRGDSGIPSRAGFTSSANLKMVVRATASDMRLFEDGTQVGTTQATADTATVLPGGQFVVGASSYQNVSGGTPTSIVNGYAPTVGTIRGYSIGEGMDSTQCAAFASAWSAFRAAMGRT